MNGASGERPPGERLPHEWWLGALFAATAALVARRNPTEWRLAAELLIVSGVWLGLVAWWTRRGELWSERPRVVATYTVILWFYSSVRRVTPAAGLPLWDESLRTADEWLFGTMPCARIPASSPGWLTDLMSVAYLGFHAYLHWGFLEALWRGGAAARNMLRCVGSAYVAGFVGYVAAPAVGPWHAYPDELPRLSGAFLSEWSAGFVEWGSSRYDAFPSLHVLVTAGIAACDWQRAPRRLAWLALPLLLVVSSTIYLGYHYAIDLVAAAGIGLVLALGGAWRIDANQPDAIEAASVQLSRKGG